MKGKQKVSLSLTYCYFVVAGSASVSECIFTLLDVQPFLEKHGLRPFMIAATAIIKGTGISFGIKVENVEGATGYYDSNLDGKARRTAEMITSDDYDFGFMHIKAVDDAGHDKRLDIKVQ